MSATSRDESSPSSRRRRRVVSYRIGTLLVALALVPLAGLGWFAGRAVNDARSAQNRAEAIDRSVARLVVLTELKTRLREERDWASGAIMVDQIGIDRDLIVRLAGYDLDGELASARAEVDRLVGAAGLGSLAPELEAVRSVMAGPSNGTDAFQASAEYESIVAVVSDESRWVLDQLLLSVGDLEGGPELAGSLRVLEFSTTAQRAFSAELNSYFSLQFSGGDRTTELVKLVGYRAVRAEAVAVVQRAAANDSLVRRAIDAIDASPQRTAFDGAEEALIGRQFEPGADDGDDGRPSLASDLGRVAVLFGDSDTVTKLYFGLVDAAAADAVAASATVGRTADRQLDRAILSATGLLVVSLLFAAAATRAVVRPVRRLAEVARRISDGDSSARFGDAGGAVEIRFAGRAMDAAAAHLELAERQAKALADGDLDHPVLARVSTGPLGASLQDAVEGLASSMQEREEFRRRMTHEATHDGLTQIANRNATMAQLRRGLARVRRSETGLAVLFIDLDGFKGINDTHGHAAGDQVLRASAQRLVNNVRDGDHVGRLGGDEFLVIAEPVADVHEAVELGRRLLEVLAEPFVIDQGMMSVNASIGIAMSGSVPDADSSDLLRDADLAVYKAKAEGRGRLEVCDETLRAALFERADIERSLRQAIASELEAFYQPIVDVDGGLRGFEALVRWNRPGHGMIRPDVFIPVAERSDLIIDIDRWMIGEAARQLDVWQQVGPVPGVPVSVNISGRHLASPTLVDDVLLPLRDRGLDPSGMIVEITESSLLEDLEAAAVKLQTLRNEGMRIAIDDFGTGYTSLAVLKSLPLDILKIDRSYTSDPSARSLVKLIIDTGHLLGATVTAEGVETDQQAADLVAMGADELQGYLFGRPVPAHQLDWTRLTTPR